MALGPDCDLVFGLHIDGEKDLEMNCNHSLAALREYVCSDCVLESLTGHAMPSLKDIMWGGPLNVWRRVDG